MQVMMGSMNIENVPFLAEVFDPIAGYRYYIDSVNQVVHRCKLSGKLQTIQLPLHLAAAPTINGTRIGPDVRKLQPNR